GRSMPADLNSRLMIRPRFRGHLSGILAYTRASSRTLGERGRPGLLQRSTCPSRSRDSCVTLTLRLDCSSSRGDRKTRNARDVPTQRWDKKDFAFDWQPERLFRV